MGDRELRRRCANLVNGLDIPTPFDVGAFCERLGRERGRPIHQLPMDLPLGGPCGLLVSTDGAEFVIYQRKASVWHQRHIVLHEVGHLLWGHHLEMTQSASLQLLPHLDPAMVNRVLARTTYSELEERQAEQVASLILERVSLWSPPREAPAGVGSETILRVEESLYGRSLGR